MKTKTLSESNFELWTLIGRLNHIIVLHRQKELSLYKMPLRQLHVLRTIKALGPKATLSEVAKQVERELNVISRQAVRMEKDGLINRIKDTPKSNQLRFELTDKGLHMAQVSGQSQSLDVIFSSLSNTEHQQMAKMLKKALKQANKYYSD